MNVVTANENKQMIDRLNIEVMMRIDGAFSVRELLSKFVNLYFNKMIIDITSIKNYQDIHTMQELAKAVDPNRVIILLNDNPVVSSPVYMSSLVKAGFYNFSNNFEGIMYLYNNPNSYNNVQHLVLNDSQMAASNQQFQPYQEEVKATPGGFKKTNNRMILGLANLTQHAGATSLTNMMVRQLKSHGIVAYGIEMFRNDLLFYHLPNDLMSCMNRNDLEREIQKRPDAQAIIIDLNEFGEAEKYCDMVLYLLEPSFIKLTKMIKKDRNAFAAHRNDRIVLNMSFVNANEVSNFEKETGLKVYFNIPPVNDRNQDIDEVNNLLKKVGFRI